MNKFIKILVALLLISSIAIAEQTNKAEIKHYYGGFAITKIKSDTDFDSLNSSGNYKGSIKINDRVKMFQFGYKFNQNLALESRYWNGTISSTTNYINNVSFYSDSLNFSSLGLFIKPIISINKYLDLYGLLGYGKVKMKWQDSDALFKLIDKSEFQYGFGTTINISNSLSFFMDYTKLANGVKNDYTISSTNYSEWTVNDIYTTNFGITLRF